MSKTYNDKKGYNRFKDSDVQIHRWVAEKKLGRKLRSGEVVHHKDRNKQNNDPDNLHVFRSQKEHDKAHKYDAYRFGKKASYQGFAKKKQPQGGCLLTMILFVMGILLSAFLISSISI